MDRDVPRARSLEERIRTAPRHSGGEFEAHLERTAALLCDWGCREALQRAGRYHSVYGNTQGRAELASRESRELIAEIGAEAERLVWIWARLDRASLLATERDEVSLVDGGRVAVSAQEHLDLVHLHAATELEQAPRSGNACRHLDPLRPVLCAGAVARLDRHQRGSRLGRFCRRLGRAAAKAVAAR